MKQNIYVWDPLVRLFHWGLVLSFIIAYLTGEEESLVHVYAGYTIFGLIAVRLIWGFVGTRHARFSDFLRSPRQAIAYLKGLLSGGARSYVGHNPAAGWMMILLLTSLLLTGLSGLQVYGLEGHGPLAQQALVNARQGVKETAVSESYESDEHDTDEKEDESGNEEAGEIWEEIHEALSNFTIFLIVLHIAGVALSSLRHKQNLTKSMISGYKEMDKDQA